MDKATCSRPDLLGNNFLLESSGWLGTSLPMLALTCLELGLLLRVSFSVGRGLWCWISWASPSSCSTRSSSVGVWPFSEKLGLWLRLSSPRLASISRHCCLHWRTLSLGWWVLFWRGRLLLCHTWGWKVFLQLGFLLWFDKPIQHLIVPQAMLPLPLVIEPWFWFVTFACPLAWGCPGEEYLFLMLRF